MNTPQLTESQEQITFVDHVLFTYQHRSDFNRLMFFSTQAGMWIAGQGRRKIGLITKYKREGMVNGVADILYLQPRGPYAFLAIEMKAPKRFKEPTGGLTEDQTEWLTAAETAGAQALTCWGAEDAIGWFDHYMRLEMREHKDR